jgi:hypothetical protein
MKQGELFELETGEYRPLIVHKPRRGRRVPGRRYFAMRACGELIEAAIEGFAPATRRNSSGHSGSSTYGIIFEKEKE